MQYPQASGFFSIAHDGLERHASHSKSLPSPHNTHPHSSYLYRRHVLKTRLKNDTAPLYLRGTAELVNPARAHQINFKPSAVFVIMVSTLYREIPSSFRSRKAEDPRVRDWDRRKLLIKLFWYSRLQTALPAHLSIASLMEKMAVDKKNKSGRKAVVLLDSIGHVFGQEPTLVEDDVLARALTNHLVVVPPKRGVSHVPGFLIFISQ